MTLVMMTADHHDHDADDVDADDDDYDDSDHDDVFSLASVAAPAAAKAWLARAERTARSEEARPRAHQKIRPPEAGPPPRATPSPWMCWEAVPACLLVVQVLGVSPHPRPWRCGFAVVPLRYKNRMLEVQGVEEVTGTHMAPMVEELCQRDVVALPDIPRRRRPARGRATLEKRGLAPLLLQDPVDFIRGEVPVVLVLVVPVQPGTHFLGLRKTGSARNVRG